MRESEHRCWNTAGRHLVYVLDAMQRMDSLIDEMKVLLQTSSRILGRHAQKSDSRNGTRAIPVPERLFEEAVHRYMSETVDTMQYTVQWRTRELHSGRVKKISTLTFPIYPIPSREASTTLAQGEQSD